jgi:hypothetical protein
MQEARREETPMTRAMPAREICSRRSNSIFAPGVGVFGVPLRIFDKLATTVTTFMVKVFRDESYHFSSHRQNHKWDKSNRVSSDSSKDWHRAIILSPLHKSTT